MGRRAAARVDALSDESLLAGLGSGDAAAGTAFIRRFQRRAYGLALGVVRDPALAEDVAQEAMARAWRHAQAFDPRKGSVTTWLLSITRNLAIDATRMRRSVPLDPDDIIELHAPSTEPAPEARAVVSDDVDRLRRAMLELPDEQRRAVVLAGLYGRTAQEVSDAQDIPLGTAKTRIRSGMIKLRSAMVDEETPAWE